MDFGNALYPECGMGTRMKLLRGETVCSCRMESCHVAEEGLESSRCVHCIFASDVHMPCLVRAMFHLINRMVVYHPSWFSKLVLLFMPRLSFLWELGAARERIAC